MSLHPNQASLNFEWSELECKCGCGTRHISSLAIEALQKVRDALGVPLTINSAARCPSWNGEVGGTLGSRHLSITDEQYSTAFDVSTRNISAEELKHEAIQAGFKGIGTYDAFVHIDIRSRKARW